MSDIKKWMHLVEGKDSKHPDHEISMANSQLLSSMKSAVRIARHLKNTSEEEGIDAWVAAKLTTAEEYLQAVADYMDGEEYNKNRLMPVTEEEFDEAAGEKDACYHKVKSRYKVFPSAYASGALVQCRKVGADNWGNKSKK